MAAIARSGAAADLPTDWLVALLEPDSTIHAVSPAMAATGNSTAVCVDALVWR
jgi:hypothetical protein